MRKVIFGMEYWVDKSRSIKTTRSTTLELMANVGRVNRDSEMYTFQHIRDPVTDKNGNAIKTKQKRKKKKVDDELFEEFRKPTAQVVVDNVLKDDQNDGNLNISRKQLSGIVKTEEPATETKKSKSKIKDDDKREKVAFFGGFSFDE